MSLRIGVDIGGTFTDVVVLDATTSRQTFAKTLSTPADPAAGVLSAIEQAGVRLDGVDAVVHGTTIVINALLERRGAVTALLTTEGFRDVYEIARVNRPDSFNPFFRKAEPLVPRERRLEVPERITAGGEVLVPLDEDAARAVVRSCAATGAEAVAIVLLHAYRDPTHELALRRIVEEEAPDLFVTCSHEISREYREYERTSTTAANAYVGPNVSRYLGHLRKRLDDAGFDGELHLMQSNGGTFDVATARRECIRMVESGPAAGVVQAQSLCELTGIDNAIAFDMGGTTAKASLIESGRLEVAPRYTVGTAFVGLPLQVPVLDIVEVGTGGGSIAWLDDVAGLHVGPVSAGADPGPACYGLGGEHPTLTDASLVLGHFDAERFLGTKLALRPELAQRAITTHVAGPLGLDVAEAAAGILRIAVTQMAQAVRAVTTERGRDPRDFVLIAYGGAGPMYATRVARELGMRRVLVPTVPAYFSSLGMVGSDIRRDYTLTHFAPLDERALAACEALYVDLAARAAKELAGAVPAGGALTFERSADMRYAGQEHSVVVSLPDDLTEPESARAIQQEFVRAHDQRFAHAVADHPVELVTLRLTAIAPRSVPAPSPGEQASPEPAAGALLGTRTAVVDDAGDRRACAVYERDKLRTGNVVNGPAFVQEAESGTMLLARDRSTVDAWGNLVVEVTS